MKEREREREKGLAVEEKERIGAESVIECVSLYVLRVFNSMILRERERERERERNEHDRTERKRKIERNRREDSCKIA